MGQSGGVTQAMICRPAEASFRKGREALSKGSMMEAQAYFEASLNLSRTLGDGPVQPRYLSYYGFCLSKQPERLSEAQQLCEHAAEAEPYDPDLWTNLARVSLNRGDRAAAHQAIIRGLQTGNSHPELLRLRSELGVRRPPMFGFLSRSNPLNVIAGRLIRLLG